MDGRSHLKQRARLVLRSFTPSRLQDELLATVYDRLLAAGSLADRTRGGPREIELAKIVSEAEQAVTTRG
jgi:hypothetical protein